ncbi:hypothetical protein X801_10634 [Opisthorchis viverrini]|uniref:glutamate synthase (ferredoxin) n=1 Tax=Opisthorchis viverrini TaxID=6198 RepID=A0A1S8WGL3_OPIVI|nr:hypothetical protein X801_10634 [Opisthorchis viverrini]
MLNRMDHRGACACDENTGDGAGVMTSIPFELYSRFAGEANKELPPVGQFAPGMIFVHKVTAEQTMEKFAGLAEECCLQAAGHFEIQIK